MKPKHVDAERAKGEMTKQRGLIVANDAAHIIISAHANAAYKVRSWQNGVAVKTQVRLFEVLRDRGLIWESVFDAAHGRRYMLFVYADHTQRKACWDTITTAPNMSAFAKVR